MFYHLKCLELLLQLKLMYLDKLYMFYTTVR